MKHVVVARPVHVDPAFQAEAVLLFALFRTEVIEERLDVLFHLSAKLHDNRFFQLEEIERIVPAPTVRPPGHVAIILHQPFGELLQSLVQVSRSVLAEVDPTREQWHYADFDSLCHTFTTRTRTRSSHT